MTQEEPKTTKRDMLTVIQKNWVWAAPLTYIYVTLVGMVQAWLLFNAFGINVFEYSELNDFLLAAFREPKSFLAIIGLIGYFVLAYLFNHVFLIWVAKKTGKYKHSKAFYRGFRIGMFSVFSVFVLGAPYWIPLFLNDQYKDTWKREFLADSSRHVDAALKDSEKLKNLKQSMKNLTLIGTTDRFVFFYDREQEDILIVPVANILLIRRAFPIATPNQKALPGPS